MTLLQRLKLLIGTDVTVTDEVLTELLEQATSVILLRRNSNVLESKYESLVLRIANVFYNKLGIEGQRVHQEGEIVRTYDSSDVPKDMLNEIIPLVKVRF